MYFNFVDIHHFEFWFAKWAILTLRARTRRSLRINKIKSYMSENLYSNKQDHFLLKSKKLWNSIIILKIYSDSLSKHFSRLLIFRVEKGEFLRRKACFYFHLRYKMLWKLTYRKIFSIESNIWNVVCHSFSLMKFLLELWPQQVV